MKMDIMSVKSEIIRLGLKAPEDFMKTLLENPAAVDQVCNGVGSETSWTYHLTSDTIWGLNINPSSHVHDWMFCYPQSFKTYAEGMAYKKLADTWFYENMCKQVQDASWILRQPRYQRARFLHWCVETFGEESFWTGKQLPVDWPHGSHFVKSVA